MNPNILRAVSRFLLPLKRSPRILEILCAKLCTIIHVNTKQFFFQRCSFWNTSSWKIRYNSWEIYIDHLEIFLFSRVATLATPHVKQCCHVGQLVSPWVTVTTSIHHRCLFFAPCTGYLWNLVLWSMVGPLMRRTHGALWNFGKFVLWSIVWSD